MSFRDCTHECIAPSAGRDYRSRVPHGRCVRSERILELIDDTRARLSDARRKVAPVAPSDDDFTMTRFPG